MNATLSKEKTAALIKHIGHASTSEYQTLGFHLHHAISCSFKPFIRKKYNIPNTPEQGVLFWTGNAFQAYLTPQQEVKGETYEVDGVFMHPDIDDVYFGEILFPLAELKTTRLSLGYWEKDAQQISHHYVKQLMGYCKAKNILEADLILFFLMGNYYNFPLKKDGIVNGKAYAYKKKNQPFPEPQVWHYVFTQKEIDIWWVEVLRRKKIFEEAQQDGGLPSELWQSFPTECKYCECSPVCPHYEEYVEKTKKR